MNRCGPRAYLNIGRDYYLQTIFLLCIIEEVVSVKGVAYFFVTSSLLKYWMTRAQTRILKKEVIQ